MNRILAAIMLACLGLSLTVSVSEARVRHHRHHHQHPMVQLLGYGLYQMLLASQHHQAATDGRWQRRSHARPDRWPQWKEPTSDARKGYVASVYGGSDGLCGSRMANGRRFDCRAMTAAHRTYPFGAKVKVCHRNCATVTITDRGPWIRGRDIDLSPAAARAIGVHGLGKVSMQRTSQIVPHPAGCPWRLSCGCIASVRVFGHSVRDLWPASNWGRFQSASAGPGMVAYRSHHVFVIERVTGRGTVIAYDGNSGGGLTRIHEVSLRGYRVVNPHARRYANM